MTNSDERDPRSGDDGSDSGGRPTDANRADAWSIQRELQRRTEERRKALDEQAGSQDATPTEAFTEPLTVTRELPDDFEEVRPYPAHAIRAAMAAAEATDRGDAGAEESTARGPVPPTPPGATAATTPLDDFFERDAPTLAAPAPRAPRSAPKRRPDPDPGPTSASSTEAPGSDPRGFDALVDVAGADAADNGTAGPTNASWSNRAQAIGQTRPKHAIPRMFRRDPHGNTLAILGGARPDAIIDAPGDKQAYSSMALILMFTATVAALSMAFALGMVFHAGWYWFLPIAIFWGLGIFAIDRALTIQLTNTKGVFKTILAVIPRLALAGVLGAVISTPVTLQIFEPEIESQIVVMQADARTAFQEKLEADPIIATEDTVRATIATNQAIVDQSAIDPLDDPTYAAAKAAEDAALADFNAKTAAWVAESNGTGGTGVVGTGPITEIAKAAADAAQVTYENAKAAADTALAAAQGSLGDALVTSKAAAETALAAAQDDLAEIETRKAEFQAQNDSAVASSDGISNRLTALDELAAASPAAGTAHIMVFLLFFAIELLPVIIKLLRNLGDKESVHDTRAKENDRAEIERIRQRTSTALDEAALDKEISLGSLMTKRALAAHSEQLALESGRLTNVEIDKRSRRETDAMLAEWDANEPVRRG